MYKYFCQQKWLFLLCVPLSLPLCLNFTLLYMFWFISIRKSRNLLQTFQVKLNSAILQHIIMCWCCFPRHPNQDAVMRNRNIFLVFGQKLVIAKIYCPVFCHLHQQLTSGRSKNYFTKKIKSFSILIGKFVFQAFIIGSNNN